MKLKNQKFRKTNFIADERRTDRTITLHPKLVKKLEQIAKREGRSASWVAEDVLAAALDVDIPLRELKTKPVMPKYSSLFMPKFGETLIGD